MREGRRALWPRRDIAGRIAGVVVVRVEVVFASSLVLVFCRLLAVSKFPVVPARISIRIWIRLASPTLDVTSGICASLSGHRHNLIFGY